MAGRKVLLISGSFGLGHAVRDLAIARELRRENPDIEISWLAPRPAGTLIEQAGERLYPEAGLTPCSQSRCRTCRWSWSADHARVLDKEVISNIGQEVTYAPIATDGAKRAARIIGGL